MNSILNNVFDRKLSISWAWLSRKEAWFAARRTVGQIPQKCKETSNLMWLSLIWFISVLFVCWNLFCTIANLRIKCVTETKNVSVLFYKNLKSSFSTWLTHLTLRFLYILGCSGPQCGGGHTRVRITEESFIECVYFLFSVIFYLLSLYWTAAFVDLYFNRCYHIMVLCFSLLGMALSRRT